MNVLNQLESYAPGSIPGQIRTLKSLDLYSGNLEEAILSEAPNPGPRALKDSMVTLCTACGRAKGEASM